MIQDPPAVPAPAGIDSGAWGAAIDEIRRYCNWHISPVATETVRIVAVDGDLVAPTLRLVAVESVTVRGAGPVALDSLTMQGNVITLPYPITGTATVAITHGYVQLPPALADAAKALVAARVAAAASPGVAALGSGPHTISRSQSAQAGYAGLPREITATLDRYWMPSCPA